LVLLLRLLLLRLLLLPPLLSPMLEFGVKVLQCPRLVAI
jgi:hypothetical protein